MVKEKQLELNRGFTIVEIMISLLVTTLVIVSYVGANVSAQKNSETMHERTVAIQNANRVIEMMRETSKTGTFPSNVVTAFPDPDPTLKVPQLNSDSDESLLTDQSISVSYCREERSPCLTADTAAKPLDVSVTVTWLSYTGRENSETVRTYIMQR